MREDQLNIDYSCHVIYSDKCKEVILDKIALHYSAEQQPLIWEAVQKQYESFLKNWRKDLGGKKNFHNGAGGTYDCIALMSYYTVCKEVTSLKEIEEMEEEFILPSFRKLKFVDCNKPFWRKLMYYAFRLSEKKCQKWQDYKMKVAPYDKNKPIYYEFTACPVAQFAKENNLNEVMPALCNVDYKAMELINACLVRKYTCSNGELCDYTICGSEDEYVKEHPEYTDQDGYRRNK